MQQTHSLLLKDPCPPTCHGSTHLHRPVLQHLLGPQAAVRDTPRLQLRLRCSTHSGAQQSKQPHPVGQACRDAAKVTSQPHNRVKTFE